MNFRATLLLPLLPLLMATASAHDLYLMPAQFQAKPGESVTISIYNGDAFPQATSRVQLQRLTKPAVHAKQAPPVLPEFEMDGTARAFSTIQSARPAHLILTIESQSRVEGMNAGEFLDYLKEENLTAVIDRREKSGEASKDAKERYTKYSKTIVRIGDGDGYFNHPVGLPIEFIPEKDPLTLKHGQTFPVQLLYKGKPIAGIQVTGAHTVPGGPTAAGPIGITDAQGRISIPVQDPGQWRLHAIHMDKTSDSEADWESFWATLTFELR